MKNIEKKEVNYNNSNRTWHVAQRFFTSLEKLGNKRHFKAMRLTFTTLVPILIIGSISTLLSQLLFGSSPKERFSLIGLICRICGNSWDDVDLLISNQNTKWYKIQHILTSVFSIINTATIGIISIYFVFLYGYYISELKGKHKTTNTVMIGFVSLSSFVISIMGRLNFFMGVNGLFSALITGVISVELFGYLTSKQIFTFNSTDNDNLLFKYLSYLIPMAITLLIISGINLIFLGIAMAWPETFQIRSSSYGSNKFDIWDYYDKKIDVDNFLDYAANKYNLQLEDLTILPKNNSQAWKNIINNFGTNNESISAWLNDFDKFSTPTGKKIFALYIFDQKKPELLGSGDLSLLNIDINNISIIYNIFTNIKSGNDELYISITNTITSIPPSCFGLSASIFYVFNHSLSFISEFNGNFGLAFTYIILISLFWFFGIHGSNVTASIFETIWWNSLINNTNQGNIGNSLNTKDNNNLKIFTKPFFDSYVNIGGVGCTLCLLICLLAFSKRKDVKRISKYSIVPSAFNINETVVFGVPIVLNGVFFIPFITAPIFAMIVGYVVVGPLHLVNVAYTSAPWSMPWLLQAFVVTGDYRSIILSIVIFIIAIFIWLPFVLLDNKLYLENLKETNPEEYNQMMRLMNDYEYRQQFYEEKLLQQLLEKEKARQDKERVKFRQRMKKNKQEHKRFIKKARSSVTIKEEGLEITTDSDNPHR
ncbi:PTS transporter subunit EIIC [Spiroplasma endosymbiont of Aspidapion aeneum]|uniref:PTS transporter subunit EIIC n=1 Tax=Spiroplasma endosymbiont of Aspidapion aeneum TaxID=3066276 RepID=UPI00313A9FB1